MVWRLFGRRKQADCESASAPPGDAAELALQHHRAGRLAQAEALYREALAKDPGNVDALHFLGVIAHQRRDYPQAVALITKALAHNAANAAAHSNLGNALAALGRRREAVAAYLEALALQPDYADALSNLGNVSRSLGKPSDAESEGAEAHFNQGNALKDAARLDDAIASYRQALALEPGFAAAHANLGSALLQQGRVHDAIASSRKALALQPHLAEAQYNLGIACARIGELPSARTALASYLQSQPDDRGALLALGEAHSLANELDEAAGCFERVLLAHADDASAHNLLGNVRRNQARHADAMKHYELAIRHGSNPVVAYQNLLFCMMCADSYSEADIHARHRDFAARFEPPLRSERRPHANTPVADRRLRIGYVSPEFRANVVGFYVQPILENHDRSAFEIHCYFLGANKDRVTERIASLADRWHDASGRSDAEIAELIRSEQIDILVDLCGHGPGNRILALARKPAPVQVSYLDYSATTGMSSIDYRLTTEYCDPSGSAEPYYSEKLLRLPASYWTYNPAVRLPVPDSPMRSNGYATFGSFNLYYRITPHVIDLWARVLGSIPRSRLVIVGVASGSTREALLERLQRGGVADRVEVHGLLSYQQYNEMMGRVDIALAPFPYNGATTVMDCLWNGLPVVAKQGAETFCTRLGCSVLALAGLPQLIARDDDEYVRIAAGLASSAPALAQLRASLRERVERSALRDFAGFTRALESAYRRIWREWCASQSGVT